MQHWGLTPSLRGTGMNAVVYQIYPRSFHDPTATASATCPGSSRIDHIAEARRRRDLALAVLSVAVRRRRLRRLRLPRRRPAPRHGRRRPGARRGGPRPRHRAPARPRPVSHVDRASMVSQAPRPYVWATPAQQLAGGVRRPGMDEGRRHRALVPALVLPRAARPRLAEPGRRRGDAGRHPVLARPGRRRVPARRHRPPGEAPRPGRRRAAGRAVPVPGAGRRRRARPPPLEPLGTGHRRSAPRASGGGGRCVPRRRGLPADRRARPIPRASRHGLRLRADVRALAGRRDRRRDRARRRPRPRLLDALEPRLQPRREPDRRERDAGRGDAPAHAPGAAFIYQGDEIGLLDGPGGDPPEDRSAATAPATRCSGRRSGRRASRPERAWLPPVDPTARNVADQEGDPGSLLHLYRALIELGRTLGGGLEMVEADRDGLLVYRAATGRALDLGLARACGRRRRGARCDRPKAEPGRLGPGAGIVTRCSG